MDITNEVDILAPKTLVSFKRLNIQTGKGETLTQNLYSDQSESSYNPFYVSPKSDPGRKFPASLIFAPISNSGLTIESQVCIPNQFYGMAHF